MLTELRIRNLAVIDDVTVKLGPGLNVLTGETGAGKSIIVGALSLLLGERASSEAVRAGTDRASVEGVFQSASEGLSEWLDEHGFEPSDGVVILKREIALEGRNRAWINGSPTTVGLLGELGEMLVSLHGQHQHQGLLRGAEQRTILDAYGGLGDLAAEVRRSFTRSADIAARIDALGVRRREIDQRAELLRFQLAEIDEAALQPGEDEQLEAEAQRLSHAEDLLSLSSTGWNTVVGGGDSATGRLAGVRRTLDQLVRIDPTQAELLDLFDSAYYALEELGARLEAYGSQVEHDPRRLEAIRRRQDLLYRLRAKYGRTIDDVVRAGEAARSELALLDEADEEMSVLARAREEAEEELSRLAGLLRAGRSDAAATLATEVSRVLPELGMDAARFEVALRPTARISASGSEDVEFLISLNRGFDVKPLSHVASGGELSRVMLALKTILARLDDVPTLIFDEVDAGIGGRVAVQVGEKMRQIAASHQVLAITHLAQIASQAHRHLNVEKVVRGDRAATLVTELQDGDRVGEIARMLGGDSESGASLAHARELIQRAEARH